MFNPFQNPFSRKNMGPWRVEDLVSPLEKPNQPPQVAGELTLQLDFSPGLSQGRKGIPRVPGHCDMCLVDETPLWRGGPNGPKTLCNACGIRYSKELKKVELVLGDQKAGKPSTGDKVEPSKGDASSSATKLEKPKEAKQATKKKQQ